MDSEVETISDPFLYEIAIKLDDLEKTSLPRLNESTESFVIEDADFG